MISHAQLTGIAAWLQQQPLGEALLPQLRRQYPGVHFTWCLDDDVGYVTPALAQADFNLYLVDGRDHCLKFTTDQEAATGVVIAEISEDE